MIKEDYLQQLMVDCMKSMEVFCKVFLPERFFRRFSTLHRQIFDILDDKTIQRRCIAAPRGFGKSSIISFAYPLRQILFKETNYVVPISLSATSAVEFSEEVKRELTTNTMIQKMFPEMKSKRWSRDLWDTSTGIRIKPRGSGQQVRGLLYGNSRPTDIIIDDIEDKEMVRNEQRRRELREWFYSDVCNSIDRGSKDWRITFVGTVLHQDSLLTTVLEDPEFKPLLLELCDDNYKSNWPDFMTDAEIRKLADHYRSQNMLVEFYQEYRNMPIALEDAHFTQEMFKFYDEGDSSLGLDDARKCENIVIMDCAKTTGPTSNDTAIICIGLNLSDNKIYIRDLVLGQFHPSQQVDEALKMCSRFNVKNLGVEVTSLCEFITYPIRSEILSRHLNIGLVELKARGKKEDRICALQPFYKKGMVHHNSAVTGPLEAQLMSFPRGKKDDAIDAEAYLIEMLDLGERWLFPSHGENEEMARMYNEDMDEILKGEDLGYDPSRFLQA